MRPQSQSVAGLSFIFLIASVAVSAQEVKIGVLGLFHPKHLTITAELGSAMVARAGEQSLVIEGSSACPFVKLDAAENRVIAHCGANRVRAVELVLTARAGQDGDFELAVPGRISRHYRGELRIIAQSEELIPIVSMPLEIAVASVLAAENPPSTPTEALKAHAIVIRSYLLAGKGRHRDFDFCDTTHCEFLGGPPAPNAPSSRAALATQGLVLTYEYRTFAAMYTRSCSGRTHTPSELGMPPGQYPYFSVDCKYCRAHPARWQSRLSTQDSRYLSNSDERARLQLVRRIGWDTVPSNDFTVRKAGQEVVVEGVGQGHGIGLCQAGASAMASSGANFRQILAHYYPNSTVWSMPTQNASRR